ncbi:hypothetical protein JHJ32_09555 [Parapedobacter sp. ISTM3]|uniref:SGNH/GDSL hydrolase family protein n=1 Tax=Parapedobacter luteus TaxID=623280 RepID=A0A1T5A6K3_9SPHI|nr:MULTISPECIES: hypothetical protein [Parapedobacter]MBK1440231.1 hypothetical protein [Parapedobacter sp. ISTM3]SKB30558.1 hypothetical protein SAMN05660226_00640 [Parapedobacter luteus]
MLTKKLPLLVISLVCCVVVAELVLRYHYGFCDAVLIREDPDYEYIAQPGQNRFRFKKHIKTNAVSMRSDEIDAAAAIILGFGDSFINGGTVTDHNSLATTLLSDTLTSLSGKKIQFLNISAGTWGPDNCFAYLNRHGNFGARAIFLFVSSHDAYDNMTFDKVVGVDNSFPNKQYTFALSELMERYVIPTIKDKLAQKELGSEKTEVNKHTNSDKFNSGFSSFASYSKEFNIPLTIYLHAEQSELGAGSYNEQGKEIIEFAEGNQIPLIKDLELGLSSDEFRDYIHINDNGQRKLAARVLSYMQRNMMIGH